MSTWSPVTGLPIQYSEDASGTAASGNYLKFYASGTTTPINMATDSTGGTTLAKCQLNSLGQAINGSSAVFIPHIDQKYKAVLYPDSTTADANTFASAIWNVDGNEQFVTVTGNSQRPYDMTVAEFKASTILVAGDVVTLSDRAGETFDIASGVSGANTFNVIANTAGDLKATLRVKSRNVYIDAVGAVGDGGTDDTAAIQAAFDIGGNIISTYGKTYLFGSQVTPTVAFNLYHYGTFKCKDAYATNGYMFSVSDLSDGVVRGSGTFDGNLAGQSISSTADDKQICFRMIGSSSNWKFKKGLTYKNWGKDAIYLGTTGQTNFEIDGYFENIRRIGVTIIAGKDIKVRGQHRLGKDQTNTVFNEAVRWEPNNSSQHVTTLDISVQCRDMKGGVSLWNANGANQEGVSIHDCQFNTITEQSAIIVYACGNTPVQINNNYGIDCGITSTDSISTEGGGISHRNSTIVGSSNVWENCGGYRATVANNGSAGKGTKYIGNTHINDKRRAIYQGYVFGTSSEPSMRNFSQNTLLGGGTDAANTYPAIEIVNTTSHNGSHDVCEHNTIRISTSSGYNAGVVVDYDDGSSTYARNKIFGTTGAKYTFTNGNPRVSGDETRGSVTLSAAATTTVTNANTQATSKIVLVPTNAAAATLMSGSKALYVSARTANTSFVLATADATNAAGTETFDWYLN